MNNKKLKKEFLKIVEAAPEWTPPVIESPFGAPAPISQWLTTKPKPIEYIFQDFLTSGIVAGLFAQGGVGKTYLLLCLALCSACGITLFPALRPTRPLRVLALLGEDPPEMIHGRVKGILKGKNIDEAPLAENLRIYSGKGAPFMKLDSNNPTVTEAFEWLRAEVEAFKPDLIIIDPKSMFYGLDENSNDNNTQWLNALKVLTTHGATALYSHHVTKTSSGTLDLNGARGGSALVDGSRFCANMRQLTDEDARRFGITEPWRYVELRVTKNSYVPRLPGSIFFEFVGGGALEQVDLKAQRDYELVETLLSALGAEAEKGNFFTAREVERSESILQDRTTRDKKYAVQMAIELGRLDTKTQPGKTRGRAVLTPRGVKF